MTRKLGPADPDWPRVWVTYRPFRDVETDVADMKAHGVGLISRDCETVEEARAALAQARRWGLKYHISLPEITERATLVRAAGLPPVEAIMIGGVYRGRAVDRHLFSFQARPQKIIVEPPVYNQRYAYRLRSGPGDEEASGERIAHYFPDMGPPARAEAVVPMQEFDGRQHLRIVPAEVREAPPAAQPERDSLAPDLPPSSETRNRKLYELRFDLTGLAGARLDRVGLAIYWPYRGTDQYWMFGHGNVSAWGASTRAALSKTVRERLEVWRAANGGTFPNDTVIAARFGDECFYITGHLNGPAVSYPLWDFSDAGIEAFLRRAGAVEYPRTWGFPEIYGPDAYAWWLYSLHEGAARLCGLAREELANLAPGVLLFRNTTRLDVFHLSNEHDGSGQELLARNLDLIHLDPYPVEEKGYNQCIARDMSYCAGLARRYGLPLVPWMQAHTYGGPEGLQHVAPEQVDRMAEEQWRQGVDAVIWLGYGRRFTFPGVRPDSWERAGRFHRRLLAAPPPKPKAQLAVLRPYRARALCSLHEQQVRNPADWLLQQLLEVWAVKHGRPYDVFELPPESSEEDKRRLDAELKGYRLVVSTEPYPGAWVIGEGTIGTCIDVSRAGEIQDRFEAELERRV